ncbi:MAG: glutathione S-transferase family protein [Cyanobacteria bacterium P01_F01_bin.13]
MLTFYYHPLSPIARQVWLALLEKDISFEPVIVDLSNREQFQPGFLALSPFHHVPVILEDGFRVIESIAILDYLESQYPTPSLLPKSNRERTIMRMIQMVTVNELVPKLPKLINTEHVPLTKNIQNDIDTALTFLNSHLGDGAYFGGDCLSLADIIVGATVPLFCRLGLDISPYAALNQWHTQITARPTWQGTHPNDADFNQWKTWIQRWIQVMAKRQTQQKKPR